MKQTRLIDANGLMNLLERELDMNGITDWGKGYMDAIHDAMEHVKFMPTIETDTVKYGKWEYCHKENIATCSLCNYEHYIGTYHQYATKYCPNCGAVMDLNGE